MEKNQKVSRKFSSGPAFRNRNSLRISNVQLLFGVEALYTKLRLCVEGLGLNECGLMCQLTAVEQSGISGINNT